MSSVDGESVVEIYESRSGVTPGENVGMCDFWCRWVANSVEQEAYVEAPRLGLMVWSDGDVSDSG